MDHQRLYRRLSPNLHDLGGYKDGIESSRAPALSDVRQIREKNGLDIKLCPQQNFYPDLTFIHRRSRRMFAVDIKTYRISTTDVNIMAVFRFSTFAAQRIGFVE